MTVDIHSTDEYESLCKAIVEECGVSRETFERLKEFERLVASWSRSKNLVARGDISHLWDRHILDSAQLYRFHRVGASWFDIGSGGGFPGMVLAILGSEQQLHMTMCEPAGKRAAFLRYAVSQLGLQAAVEDIPVQSIQCKAEMPFSFITSRAVANLSSLLDLSAHLFQASTRGLFLKGQTAAAEWENAKRNWEIEGKLLGSVTSSLSSIVRIDCVKRKP